MSMWTVRDGTYIACDLCGARSPFFEDWEDAVAWATERGWDYDRETKENYCKECKGEL